MPNTDWKQVCAACAEGTQPARCAYYGDPNGCNAPTLGKHPEGDLAERLQEALEKAERRIAELERATGNAAALREALRECRDELYEIQGMSELDDTRIALLRQKSNAALTAPPEPLCNSAAMREALNQLRDWALLDLNENAIRSDEINYRKLIDGIIEITNAALAAPARNCDVGTAEEQAQRFHAFCSDNTSEIEGMCNSTCPCIDCGDKCHCLCVWSQMPFDPAEGGAE